jgi:hypothetical protein
MEEINMPDVAVNLQTPILKSTRDRLKELQEERGHDNAGETIGMLLEHHERYLGLTE